MEPPPGARVAQMLLIPVYGLASTKRFRGSRRLWRQTVAQHRLLPAAPVSHSTLTRTPMAIASAPSVSSAPSAEERTATVRRQTGGSAVGVDRTSCQDVRIASATAID